MPVSASIERCIRAASGVGVIERMAQVKREARAAQGCLLLEATALPCERFASSTRMYLRISWPVFASR